MGGCPTGLEQQHLVARVFRQPVRDGRTSRTGADNKVIVGLHGPFARPHPRRLLLTHYAKGPIKARQCLPPTKCLFLTPLL